MKNKILLYYIFFIFFNNWFLHANHELNIKNNAFNWNQSNDSPKLTILSEPIVEINENGPVSISFSLRNLDASALSISDIAIRISNVTSNVSIPSTNSSISNISIPSYGIHQVASIQILTSLGYEDLDAGAYTISFEYKLAEKTFNLPLSFFRKLDSEQLETYEVNKHDYHGLPIYALRGGMSAEYAVQKSLAALNKGVSQTWDVRKKLDGTLDLGGGGPVSVYSTPHFLKKSIEKTVELYNTELGANKTFNTVIISTGVPTAPYLSYYMGAPILPLHFLATVNSFAEVNSMVYTAKLDGYSTYATAGYDPSIEEEGVAWIKLLDLPEEYKQFIIDHNVENVILMGATELGGGEVGAKRINLKFPVANPSKYEEGSVYVMTHGGSVGLQNLKDYFKDFDDYLQDYEIVPEVAISDWESGITKSQSENFKTSIKNQNSSIKVYAIEGSESIGFYNITVDLSLKFWKKNEALSGKNPVSGIAMNEYLIGYPGYESKVGQIPMLYWQFDPKQTAGRVKDVLKYKTTQAYPSINFNSLPVKFNAKYDRSPFIDALISNVAMSNVGQNEWQKADVWNTTDGMGAPCELVAKDIINNLGGATTYQTFISNLTKLTIEDLKNMVAIDETATPLEHPKPTQTINVANVEDAGLNIKRYEFASQPYWNSREQLKEMGFYDYNTATPSFLGWIDGYSKTGNNRKQRITISQFDLGNTSDEYDLKVGYKFHPTKTDELGNEVNLDNYDAALGDEQKMSCFEYTKVPKTSWLDIPSRVMAREGAVWIVNGSVYDWDYNGIPGVVPFIKKEGLIKAQPQILSYKGEGAFAWNWGAQKSVSILGRPQDVPENGLANELTTLFQTETASYSNVLGGMTFMNGGNKYDVNALQPDWMLNYGEIDQRYLGPSGTSIRCFLSNPDPTKCKAVLESAWGSFDDAPKSEGWNDCSSLSQDEFVKRFSTVAYKQYDKLFERVPNARTYVAIKNNKLDIGIIDGDLGNFSDTRGVNYSKTFGMKNSEVSEFYRYKGYDKLVNLDGGSSSQIWYNGRGPLHDWTGYPLVEDNQGPYFSRLVSSYLMLIPKKHTDQISTYKSSNTSYLLLDNSDMTFNYDDNADHGADKAFVSLSPNLDKLTIGEKGLLAGNFKIENVDAAKGAILYYQGEDTYYEDTEGLRRVVPRMRNIMLVGIGKIPGYILKAIKGKPASEDTQKLTALLEDNNQGMYFIKMHNGIVIQYFFENDAPYTKYIDNEWHSFMLHIGGTSRLDYPFSIKMDNIDTVGEKLKTYGNTYNFFAMNAATHATIGAANIDGRFVTGNAKLAVDNYLFAIGGAAVSNFTSSQIEEISNALTTSQTLPNLMNKYNFNGTYALQFEENSGKHSFALAENNELRLYGLNLNTQRIKTSLENLTPIAITPGEYYTIDSQGKCVAQNSDRSLKWKVFKDADGNANWTLCAQVTVADESISNNVSTNYDRSLKLNDKYISIDPELSQITSIPGSEDTKVSNHKLEIVNSKAIVIPYKIGDVPIDGGTEALALTKNNISSFSYHFIEAKTELFTPVASSGQSYHSVKYVALLAGSLTGGALLTGAASYGAYGIFKYITGRNKKYQILQGEDPDNPGTELADYNGQGGSTRPPSDGSNLRQRFQTSKPDIKNQEDCGGQ